MKNNHAQQVRVGIFVTMGLALSMLVIFLLGDLSGILEQQYKLIARFEDISGLRLGAPIYLAGINVGKVDNIQFPHDLKETKVVVTLALQKTYQDRIRGDSVASIVTQGLLGDKAIFVTVGSAKEGELKGGDEIKIKQGLSLDTFAEKGGELIENINELTEKVNGLLTDVKNKDSLVNALLYDPQGKEIIHDLSGMVNSAKGIVREIQNGRGVLHALIYDPTKQNVGEKFSKTVANFETVSQNLSAVSGKIEQGEGSIGGLINDPTVYYDLMTLLGNANRNKLLRTVIRATLSTNEKDLTGGN